MEQFDVIVIGGGPGGYVAAIRAAQLGGQVALIEKDKLGGTCLNWGCIPTKSLVKSATLWRELNQAANYGFAVEGLAINYPQIVSRKDQVVAGLVAGLDTLIKKNKIKMFKAIGQIKQPGEVMLIAEDEPTKIIKGKSIIIATGSQGVALPIPGVDHPDVLNSNTALELTRLPNQIIIIGAGVVGIEFASIFSAFGVEVTLVEMLPGILPMVDEDLTKRLRPLLKKDGINLITSAKLSSLEKTKAGFKAKIETSKETLELNTSHVLVAAGRVPSLHGIDVEMLGLQMNKNAIAVNNRMETNITGIYAIGDVVGGEMLAHVASFEGMVAAENAMGHNSLMDYRAVPSCIFCYPEIASVGLTEAKAKENGIDYVISKFPFTASGKAMAMGETNGLVKLLADKNSGVIIGGHIMGPHASDLIGEVCLAVKNKLTAEQIVSTIHAHPTLSETIMEAAHGLFDKPIHLG